jgi:hypothetical protein
MSSIRRLGPALISGTVAIALNTLALKVADFLPLATAKGGLLRLLRAWFTAPLTELGIAAEWSRIGAPGLSSDVFQIGFHLAVGIVMALAYAYVVEPALPGRDAQKGALYAIAVWLLNAFVVLPATGEGFAGSAHLTLAGITWFAGAHTLFFMVLAMAYGALRSNYRIPLACSPNTIVLRRDNGQSSGVSPRSRRLLPGEPSERSDHPTQTRTR